VSELSRRALLGWLAAGTACTWLGPAAARTRRGWVDVHHHFIPPGYAESFAQMRAADGSTVPVPPTNWDLQRDLEDMDRGGVSTAILSMFVPPTLGTVAQRAQLARLINEAAA